MLKWNHSTGWLVAAACAVLLTAGAAVAEDDSAPAEAPEAPSAAEIAPLVEQLDAQSFAERQAASERLSRIGRPAIEALAAAAVGDSLEVTVRAIDILKELMDSGDPATDAEAKEAMGRIAESDRAAAARRAADALRAAKAKRAAVPFPRAVPGAAAIQLNVGGVRRVSVRTVEGVKTIEAEEADRKIHITEDPKDGIKMEVTSQKDGKDVTDRYEAKDAEELQKQHPEAYEIYKQYSRMGGAGPIAIQVQAGGIQALAPVQRPGPIDMAARMLPGWGNSLDRLATDEAIREASKESREELKKRVGEVREQLERLEKRLQEALDEAGAEP